MPRLRFKDPALVLRLVEAAVKSGKPLMLAHDHGVYLCHDDIKHPAPGTGCICAFVDGMEPEVDPEAFETANAFVGFDDFGISIPLGGQDALLADLKRGHRLAINFGRRAVTIVTQAGNQDQPPQKTHAARGRGAESQPTARDRSNDMTATKTTKSSKSTKSKSAKGDSKSTERLRKAAIAEIGERIATLEAGGDPSAEATGTANGEATQPAPTKAAKGGTGKAAKASKPTAPAMSEKVPAKRAKPAKEAKVKRLSALDAAAMVLASAKEPMNAEALIVAMAERKLWTSPNGQTPAQTLYAALSREINAKGRGARFIKVERGHFAINGKAA